MIFPTKYLDLDTSLIRVAAFILATLSHESAVHYQELDQNIASELGEAARINLTPALGLLFTLGKLDYDTDADVIVGSGMVSTQAVEVV